MIPKPVMIPLDFEPEVHDIIRRMDAEKQMAGNKRISLAPGPYLIAFAVILTLIGVCYPFQIFLGYQTIALILLFGVTLLPLWLETGPVILAATLSALAWNYFFIPPYFTFVIDKPQDTLMFIAYFVIAAVTGVLTSRVRAREKAIRLKEQRTMALYTLTRDLASAQSLDGIVGAAIGNIQVFFEAEALVCLSESDGDMLAKPHPQSGLKIDDREFRVIAWTYWNEKQAGKFTEMFSFGQATYFPLSGPRYPLGVLGVKFSRGEEFTADQLTLLENFAAQIASGIEREQLNELSRQTSVLEESEKLYKTLFESISHEFKTPIATILGSAERLLESPHADEMLVEIRDAAERLNRLVANLLDQTRLESGFLKPKPDWCDVSDLIHTTLAKLENELGSRKVSVSIAENMPLLRVDIGFMEQVLMNLLHNAARYTPPGTPVEISVREVSDQCQISISDSGPGISPEIADRVFQKFYRVPGSKAGGTGLGLSIARGFVEMLGGSISLDSQYTLGARFVIRLPIQKQPLTEPVS